MTRMVEQEQEPFEEEEAPRSVFSAMWFRAVLVVVVLGVIAALAVPYVMEWVSPEPPTTAILKPPPAVKPPSPGVVPPALPPATGSPPPPAAAPAAPAAVAPRPGETPKPPEAAKPAEAPPAAAPPRVAEAPKPPAKPAPRPAPAARPSAPPARAPAGTGTYFVQVGAFKDPEAARRLAARLRERKFQVEESTTTVGGAAAGPADRYNVFVTGGAPEELAAKLTAKGLASTSTERGVMVTPSLPLRDAVALSKDLAAAGLVVQVRRATGEGGPADGGQVLHRVRVGPYPTRAAATAARRELEAAGHKGFIARGGS